MILPKFELIWLESDTAQTLQSLHGNYYGETNFFVHCSLAFSHITLVKSSLAILMGNFLSYNFAEDHFSIKCKEQKLLITQVTSVLRLCSLNGSAGNIDISGTCNRAPKSWLLCCTAKKKCCPQNSSLIML